MTSRATTLSASQVLQEVTLVNTTDAAFTASATLTGKGFSGPRDVSVPPKSSSTYTLTFAPLGSGTYSGTLELYIAATGERNVYSLVGKGGEPMAEGHLVVECQVRTVMCCCCTAAWQAKQMVT